ncbi:MAG: GNAT family N-acetyltransferase, partial [Bacteroidales bacterium]|nr:GNAT family N-acetyltransferase [Bacteroidales bacterium]
TSGGRARIARCCRTLRYQYAASARHSQDDAHSYQVPGNGIASEALAMLIEYGFNTLNLHKITCDTFADNLGTIKHLEKVGLRQEGRLRKHYFHQGEYKDALIYSILREDFKSN